MKIVAYMENEWTRDERDSRPFRNLRYYDYGRNIRIENKHVGIVYYKIRLAEDREGENPFDTFNHSHDFSLVDDVLIRPKGNAELIDYSHNELLIKCEDKGDHVFLKGFKDCLEEIYVEAKLFYSEAEARAFIWTTGALIQKADNIKTSGTRNHISKTIERTTRQSLAKYNEGKRKKMEAEQKEDVDTRGTFGVKRFLPEFLGDDPEIDFVEKS